MRNVQRPCSFYVDGEVTVLSGMKLDIEFFYLAGTPDESSMEGDFRNCTLHYAALSAGMIKKNFETGRVVSGALKAS